MKILFHGADQAELLAGHKGTGNPKTTFPVHGEVGSMQIFAKKIEKYPCGDASVASDL